MGFGLKKNEIVLLDSSNLDFLVLGLHKYCCQFFHVKISIAKPKPKATSPHEQVESSKLLQEIWLWSTRMEDRPKAMKLVKQRMGKTIGMFGSHIWRN